MHTQLTKRIWTLGCRLVRPRELGHDEHGGLDDNFVGGVFHSCTDILCWLRWPHLPNLDLERD
jgi:hypothetical protein